MAHTSNAGVSSRGFTLIELLVVVTVIGVLAAFLFPTFARVREDARRTTCASNLRQIGQAFNMYAQDYDGRLPDQRSGVVNTATLYRAAWEIYLRPYTKNAAISRCPSDMLSKPIVVARPPLTLLSSYATPFNVEGRALASIGAPASTVLQAEDFTGDLLNGVNWQIGALGKKSFALQFGVVYQGPDFRHNASANYLFVDTHVKAYPGPNPAFQGYRVDQDGVAQCGPLDPLPQ